MESVTCVTVNEYSGFSLEVIATCGIGNRHEAKNPTDVDIYTKHSVPTTVAKYSPSGFYIASGDTSGKIRIWDATQKEHILKNEFQPISGAIRDISWTSDSQRICVVGEGRERFGHVFNAETGTSVGEIMGQSILINACDFKPTRPFRLVTASEDKTVAFYEGPPFKFKTLFHDLTRFANCVRYAPDGETFTSAGADGKAFVYEGKTGDKLRELGAPAHKGGIYAISYSPDSKQILTVSGDKTAKIFEVGSGDLVQEFVMGKDIEDMQVGCLWQGSHLLTVSLSGHFNYLNRDDPSTHLRVIRGHNKPITALATSEDKTFIFTGASDGKICVWKSSDGSCELMSGKGHSNQVQDMKVVGSKLITVAMDDTMLISDAISCTYGNSVKLPSQPRGLDAAEGGLCVVACINHVVVVRDGNIVFTQGVSWEASCVTIHPGLTEVAVGGTTDKTVHIFELNGDTLVAKQELDQSSELFCARYSHDGKFLATADARRAICLYELPEYKTIVSRDWTVHTARVNSLDWSPDSSHICSASLDCMIAVFDASNPRRPALKFPGAHLMTNITRCAWLDDNTLVSAATDSNIKLWNVIHKE